MVEEQIEALKKQLQQIDELHLEREALSSPEFIRWREATMRQIKRVFGDQSEHVNKFNSISYITMAIFGDEHRQLQVDQRAYIDGLKTAKTRLLVMIDELNEREKSGEILIAQDATLDQTIRSIAGVAQILQRFRECCHYLTNLPQEEKDLQAIIWIMLRSHFDNLEKEETLPRFGIKSYRPDFGIPDLKLLIEAKFIGVKTNVSNIQEEILGDIPGYLKTTSNYDTVIVFVYDAAHKLRDSHKFISDIGSVEGIAQVIVVPGLE